MLQFVTFIIGDILLLVNILSHFMVKILYMRVEIKEYRKANKIKQKDLAKRVGVTRSCISQYEIGAREPDLVTLMKLAYELNVTPDELLDYDTFKNNMDKNKSMS